MKPTDEALRAKAAVLASSLNTVADIHGFTTMGITIPSFGTIHRTERVAFVEAVIAVPLQEDGSIAK